MNSTAILKLKGSSQKHNTLKSVTTESRTGSSNVQPTTNPQLHTVYAINYIMTVEVTEFRDIPELILIEFSEKSLPDGKGIQGSSFLNISRDRFINFSPTKA